MYEIIYTMFKKMKKDKTSSAKVENTLPYFLLGAAIGAVGTYLFTDKGAAACIRIKENAARYTGGLRQRALSLINKPDCVNDNLAEEIVQQSNGGSTSVSKAHGMVSHLKQASGNDTV